MTVDGIWSTVGSTNWDQRSLRLNFEFNIEAYDSGLASKLDQMIEARIARARRLTLGELQGRPFLARLRDGVARLMTPYL